MKFVVTSVVMVFVAVIGFTGGSIDTNAPGWLTFQKAEASPYRRSVRRTARRTSRRTSRRVSARHNYYGGRPYYGGAAVVAGAAVVGAVAVGTMVATLPPACREVIVNGVRYKNCDGAYYAPRGSQYIVVDDPYY